MPLAPSNFSGTPKQNCCLLHKNMGISYLCQSVIARFMSAINLTLRTIALLMASLLAMGLLTMALLGTSAMAAPTMDGAATPNTLNGNQHVPNDPQVAPQPASPFNPTVTPSNDPVNNEAAGNPYTAQPLNSTITTAGALTNPLNNPNSLASTMQPHKSDLSAANQELLSHNAQLQRDVNDLETRVNVLINERSGQLFLYGAITVAVSLIFGFLLGGFIFSRRDHW